MTRGMGASAAACRRTYACRSIASGFQPFDVGSVLHPSGGALVLDEVLSR